MNTTPAPAAGTSDLAVWTLTVIDAARNVTEGDYYEMYVVAQSAADARAWAYRRAVLDNKANPNIWRDGDEFTVRTLRFYDVDDNEPTGVCLTETWTVDKIASAPFRRR